VVLAADQIAERRVWSRPESPIRGAMAEFPAQQEGLATPDMPEALVGDDRVDDRSGIPRPSKALFFYPFGFGAR
jgi:hypothetical protein